jgi:NodT family efflux transporter outer membrane factor (OMF) lipoprotein
MRRLVGFCAVLGAAVLSSSCLVGPNYKRPSATVTPGFKEPPPPEFKEANGWKVGEPRDDQIRGKWWEVFQDPLLNSLEEQVNVSNLTIVQAEAQFRQARAAVGIARAALFPTLTAGTSIINQRQSGTIIVGQGKNGAVSGTGQITEYTFPTLNLSYEADVWGRVRRNIEANVDNAQASAADLETMRLSMTTELATDYFNLRGQDAQKRLLDSTVTAYAEALKLTQDRFNQGIASQVDVAQAQTQLETTRAQATDLGVQRTQLEHAIAVLVGKAPAELTIPMETPPVQLPAIPVALPTELLERRPDIASAERMVAAANAQIGVAKAAYYPALSFSASAGLESSSLKNLFTWPSRFWSLGPSLVETVFDGGLRRATDAQAIAAYDAMVAAYRLSVLTAFQNVEDALSGLRVLSEEAKQEEAAVKAAEQSLDLANVQYKGGITTYLQVITAQEAALGNERTSVSLQTERITTIVALIKALGGGWDTTKLPSAAELTAKMPPPPAPGATQPAAQPKTP